MPAQAGRRHAQRPISCALLDGERLRADLVEQVLEGVEAEHRALEARGADVDAEQVEHVRGRRSRPRPSTGLPLISSVSSDADAWLIAQPRPVNPTSLDDAVVDAPAAS